MKRQEVIHIAHKAGLANGTELPSEITAWERFAERVAAAEREACAKVCDDISKSAHTLWKERYDPHDQGREMGATECEDDIRARGQKEPG